MYASLLLPWSDQPSQHEQEYRSAGLVKTKGTIFLLPPAENVLRETYNAPPRPKTLMSSGAVALCKHFERDRSVVDPVQGKNLHPFWELPVGSNENKSLIAEKILNRMLCDAVWRNVIWLHEGVVVYEIRNALAYGMRWTLDVEEGATEAVDEKGPGHIEKNYRTSKTTFRGLLEPIEGLEHEVDGAQASK